VICELDSDSRK